MTSSELENRSPDERVRVYLLLSQKKYDLAEQRIRALIGSDPQDHELFGLLADAMMGQSRHGEALGAAEQAVQMEPGHAMHLYRVALARLHLGEHEKGLDAIDEALKLTPEDADLHGLRAQALSALGREAEALQAAEAGLAIDPTHRGCQAARAVATHWKGDPDTARSDLLEQLAANPNDDVVHCQLANVYLFNGDHEKAADHFREALRIDPNYSAARQGLIAALQARNTTFALLLRFGYWLNTLPKWAPWVGLIALLAAPRIVQSIGGDGPVLRALAGFAVVVVVILSQLAMCADAFFILMLRFDRKSRNMLSRAQRSASNWQAVSMLLMGLTLIAWPLLGRISLIAGIGTFASLTTSIPYAFRPALPASRRKVVFAVGMGIACGLLSMFLAWPVTLVVLVMFIDLSIRHVLFTACAFLVAGWYFFERAEKVAEELVRSEQLRGITRSEFE